MQRQADSERLLKRHFTCADWDEEMSSNLYMQVLRISGNDMGVRVYTEYGPFDEIWNLAHFEHGLTTGFYRQIKPWIIYPNATGGWFAWNEYLCERRDLVTHGEFHEAVTAYELMFGLYYDKETR